MKYMMFVVVDPDAAAEAEPSENDLTIAIAARLGGLSG